MLKYLLCSIIFVSSIARACNKYSARFNNNLWGVYANEYIAIYNIISMRKEEKDIILQSYYLLRKTGDSSTDVLIVLSKEIITFLW